LLTSIGASERVIVLHDVVYERIFVFNRLWGRPQFRTNRAFAPRRGAFAACEAHHSIVREWPEHSRAVERASGTRRGR
jgi:hypothetical protein